MKITFFLETTTDDFARWLEDYTLRAPYRDFPTEKGRIVLQPARISFRHPTLGYIRIDMKALYIAPLDKGNKEAGEPLDSAISFKVMLLASERIEVTAESYQPVVQDYFEELLTDIGRRWPEAKEWLEVKIGQALPDDFPRKDQTVKRYKKAYDIILQTRKRFYDCWKKGDFDNPTPKVQDYKDALAYHMGWKPCDKTLRKILRLGDDGYLK